MKCFIVVLCFLSVGYGLPGLPIPESLQQKWGVREGKVLPNCGVSKDGAYDDGDRIVGGRDANQGELPWQISLQQKSWWGNTFSHICGGTILNKDYIITAAHCVDGGSASEYQVVVGGHNLRSPSKYHKAHAVSSIKVHEQYDDYDILNDIAILKLSESIDIEGSDGHVNGACLPSRMSEPDGYVSISGWGATREGGSAPAVLQVVDVPVVTNAVCRQQYGSSAIADSMLCAGVSTGGKDSCQGDSGGPLVQRVNGQAQLLGVVSWGYGCARPGYSGVYTKVSHFIDWIEENAL